MANDQAFPPAPVGTPEFATLPAGLLLKATAAGNYFDHSSDLFWPLFNYISSHKIAMTTPVEAQIDGAAMFFWVAEGERSKAAGSSGGVEVIEVAARRVARLGARGGYTAANFAKTRDALQAWLNQQKEAQPDGPAYAVYWNGPFLPGFLKRFEVQIPLRTVPPRVSGGN